MKVLKPFYSIQGEGTFIGTPAIFIRMVGCNLSCDFCDEQDFIPDPEDMLNTGGYYIRQEVLPLLYEHYCTHIVITGGEPLLQEQGVLKTIKSLTGVGFKGRIQIETNGTQLHAMETIKKESHRSVWITCSPKRSFTEEEFAIIKSKQLIDELKYIVTDNPIKPAKLAVPIWLQPCWPKVPSDKSLDDSIKRAIQMIESEGRKNIRLGIQAHKYWGIK